MYHKRAYGIVKSTFCMCFLQKRRSLCTEHRFRGGFFGVSVFGPIFHKSVECIKFEHPLSRGVPVDLKKRGEPSLFIMDGMLNDAYSSGRLCERQLSSKYQCHTDHTEHISSSRTL